MTQIIVLPHEELCPEGALFEAQPGTSICDSLLANGIDIEHACEKSCACTTCHVIVREGFDSLGEADELEEDLLDKAWGLEPYSRLSCQAKVSGVPLVVEIPKYTINMVSEGKH
ncbi:ISC system 2Fe-2S type ferredoxin [Cognatazoarcus halotolerans]|uniref:ISC system 2Fe-2S type ferredoxin n=1 Tax=Cognatazoarcus halotolerans TaxID=2686016 RepID=UPI001357FAA0|nr:ISC system 2Fe-2S type ferredoxin [Cognatazoarcus halotolerans]MBX3679027.1 ISC system 2Fe-2S type ferredoxin [Rhodocyclaceae bacterium]MCB1900193.1 ISC system 2Fe-2S type ferredoxin [Rhodocyclaceae bacterium]MCP5309022.1 ISC system 2Fe-2S type ferredoxin [Zoogloeaceae bacterium]